MSPSTHDTAASSDRGQLELPLQGTFRVAKLASPKLATRDRKFEKINYIFLVLSARVGTRTATKTDTLNQNKFVLSWPQEHEHDAHTYDERTFDLTTHISRALKVSRGQPRNAHDHNAGYCKRQFCMQKKSLSKFCADVQCTSEACVATPVQRSSSENSESTFGG